MATIQERIYDIPMDELTTAVDFALESLQMDKERVMKRYADTYNETLARCHEDLKCQGIYKGFSVVSKSEDEIELEGGVVLKSKKLAEVLHRADEIVAYAVTVNGHDELMADPDLSMFENMFCNAWGVGFSMSAHRWFKKAIQKAARDVDLYASRGWFPGEEGVELNLQNELFELIDPSRIGISLSDTGVMTPVMSVNGFIGICADPAICNDGKDNAEQH
jgi:hypothetical protein